LKAYPKTCPAATPTRELHLHANMMQWGTSMLFYDPTA
jgi:hypothetical protein